MAAVNFDKVVKSFGAFTAVHGLDLAIDEGEFVSLLGPSGCGKTTTLRMLAGLEFPTSGEISIGDRVVNDLAPGERDIAMVFQSYALYPHMTVAQNIAYPLKKRGVPKSERGAMVQKTAELLQLTELLSRKPRQLSGGQQQRVALGRALVRDPKVFLLDEPLSNLDAKLRGYMRVELVELHRRLGRTMVYVTHDQLEAMTMSDRIAVMEGGRLQQFAPPTEVYRAPANRFVAGFIGTPAMNLIDGEIRQSGGTWQFHAPGLTLDCPPLLDSARPGPACLGIRPEGVVFGSGPIEGVVQVVEQTGHENIVVARIGADMRLTGRVGAERVWQAGETVRCGIDIDRAHIFAAGAAGERLNRPGLRPVEAPAVIKAAR
ncbi:ABC transporter ATP-binding protein [Jannaschia seohaensis]|uniref:Multiple sugar transport system ATP-binding protein n=1 Tax=Jannaschia seohaensis TaxID=475081 RepID=A0A2Y9B227_9RHOB|nr:ABC transporter ATP-binding protein [Jannaschia seohaensis]PWJ17052.1 multiple sugar transport system ATP-binding protein [Jannaschia seohaensis]SSA48389.1 multiple sugar transport system ATP-binding protein [Jannaschia seohaensis]